MKLNSCIIDHFYAALLIRKAQWAHPTVHLKLQEGASRTKVDYFSFKLPIHSSNTWFLNIRDLYKLRAMKTKTCYQKLSDVNRYIRYKGF